MARKIHKMRLILVDRLLLILRVVLVPLSVRFEKKEKNADYVFDLSYDLKRVELRIQQLKNANLGSEFSCLGVNDKIVVSSFGDLKFLKLWLLDVIVVFKSLFDLSELKYNWFVKFSIAKYCVFVYRPRRLFIYSFHSPASYLLATFSSGRCVTYISTSNSTLFTENSRGNLNGCRILASSSFHFKELEYLKKRGWLKFNNDPLNIGNEFSYEVSKMSRTIEYDLGFYSSGFWARDEMGNRLAISNGIETRSSLLELELLKMAVKIANEENLKLGIFLHPHEKDLISRGFESPWVRFVNNENVFIDNEFGKVSNIFSSKIAITYQSSIIYDRGQYGLITLVPSKMLKEKFQVVSIFRRQLILADVAFDNEFQMRYKIKKHLN